MEIRCLKPGHTADTVLRRARIDVLQFVKSYWDVFQVKFYILSRIVYRQEALQRNQLNTRLCVWVCHVQREGVAVEGNVKISMLGVAMTAPSWSCKGKQSSCRRVEGKACTIRYWVSQSFWKSGVRASITCIHIAVHLCLLSWKRHCIKMWYFLII